MTRAVVYLARHALTDWLLPGIDRLAGRIPGIPLNAEGRAQAAALARALAGVRLDRIASSPIERARETAAAVARAQGLRVDTDGRLAEWGMGEWEGRRVDDLIRDHPDEWRTWHEAPDALRLRGAEPLAEMADRMEAAFWSQAERGGRVLIVSHRDPLLCLICRLLGAPLNAMPRLELAPASLTEVEVRPRPVIRALNRTAHLGGPAA